LRTLRAEHSRALEEREGDLARLREQHAAEADTAQRVRDAARTARERAAELEASREAALTARRQRDDALVAHRALQRRVDGLLATESATDPAPATTGHVAAAPDDGEPAADPETPIGIRALPSAAGLAPGLHRAERPVRASPSRLDLWAIRTVGAITAGCFLLLLLLLLRVFL
ncbi:MAG: hypothetical protein H0V81_07780, partial [Solirubrobacterales bacterium]|nr:hypothetical protein [Solirubrobacterales bacterium]